MYIYIKILVYIYNNHIYEVTTKKHLKAQQKVQQIYNPKQYIKNNIPYIKIKFIRNPYDRAVSGYLHVMSTKIYDRLPIQCRNMSFLDFLKSYNVLKNITYADHLID